MKMYTDPVLEIEDVFFLSEVYIGFELSSLERRRLKKIRSK
jgi:hypothetical protein